MTVRVTTSPVVVPLPPVKIPVTLPVSVVVVEPLSVRLMMLSAVTGFRLRAVPAALGVVVSTA